MQVVRFLDDGACAFWAGPPVRPPRLPPQSGAAADQLGVLRDNDRDIDDNDDMAAQGPREALDDIISHAASSLDDIDDALAEADALLADDSTSSSASEEDTESGEAGHNEEEENGEEEDEEAGAPWEHELPPSPPASPPRQARGWRGGFGPRYETFPVYEPIGRRLVGSIKINEGACSLDAHCRFCKARVNRTFVRRGHRGRPMGTLLAFLLSPCPGDSAEHRSVLGSLDHDTRARAREWGMGLDLDALFLREGERDAFEPDEPEREA